MTLQDVQCAIKGFNLSVAYRSHITVYTVGPVDLGVYFTAFSALHPTFLFRGISPPLPRNATEKDQWPDPDP